MNYKFNRAWAEINLDNIAHNIKQIKKHIGSRVEIMAVVKADAYGHGIKETVKTMIDNGATWLAVSMLDEAIQLREIGINIPILVLNYTDPNRASEILKHDITQTVFSHDLALALSREAVNNNKKIKIHIKIDTGMTRVGFKPGYEAVKAVTVISKLPGIIIEGIFTHFAAADEEDNKYTKMQLERFESIIVELERIGIIIPYKHAANSAGIIQYKEALFNIVRAGIILYGLNPSRYLSNNILDLKPAMSLKANIVHLKEVEKDIDVSYGRTYTTKRNTKIATIPVGYADGYSRKLSSNGKVIINDQYAHIIGRVCMDQCMVDITDINGEVKVGDEIILLGTDTKAIITADDIAEQIGTINYEIVCIIGKRIPRVYKKNGEVKRVINYLLT